MCLLSFSFFNEPAALNQSRIELINLEKALNKNLIHFILAKAAFELKETEIFGKYTTKNHKHFIDYMGISLSRQILPQQAIQTKLKPLFFGCFAPVSHFLKVILSAFCLRTYQKHSDYNNRMEFYEGLQPQSLNKSSYSYLNSLDSSLSNFIESFALVNQKKTEDSPIPAKLILKLFLPFHTLISCLLLAQHPFSQSFRKAFSQATNQAIFYRTFQIALYCLNIVLVGCILSVIKKPRIMNMRLFKFVVANFSVLMQVNLTSVFVILQLELAQNLPLLLSAILTSFFQTIFLGNFCMKKQTSYQRSFTKSIILKAIVISQLITNSVIIKYGSFRTLQSVNIIFSLLILGWHITGGATLFTHRLPRKLMIASNSVSIGIGMQSLVLTFRGSSGATFSFIQLFMVIFSVFIFLNVDEMSQGFHLTELNKCKNEYFLKDYQLSLDFILEHSSRIDVEGIILGLINSHLQNDCPNKNCWTKKSQIYDPDDGNLKTFDCKMREKRLILKYYIKCLYETAIQNNKTKRLLIDYCQFMVSEFADFSTHCLYLQRLLSENDLSLFQRIKVISLVLLLQQSSINFNKSLSGRRAQVAEVLKSQKTFESIKHNISHYCKENIKVWSKMGKEKVSIAELKQEIKENFDLLQEINESWKKLSTLFHIHKEWIAIYLNYSMYLKNEKVKNKHLVFDEQIYNLITMKTTKERFSWGQISDTLFFDRNSAIFMTELKEKELIFAKVNSFFQAVVHYRSQQVIGNSLNMIIPQQNRQKHHTKFWNWFQNDQTIHQKAYYLKKTQFLNKSGEKVECIYLFKVYIELVQNNKLLNFVCLLNKNITNLERAKESAKKLIILNQNRLETEKQNSGHQTSQQYQRIQLRRWLQSNIFMKQQHLEPKQNHQNIKNTKFAFKMFLFLYLSLCIGAAHFLKVDVSQIQQQMHTVSAMADLYLIPFQVTQNFIKDKIKRDDKLVQESQKLIGKLQKIKSSGQTLKLLSDPVFNIPAMYTPLLISQAQKNISFDQIDLFYAVYSYLLSLTQNSSMSDAQSELAQLQAYLQPAYDSMLHGIKISLHDHIQSNFSRLVLQHYLQMLASAILLGLGGLYMINQIRIYESKMLSLLNIVIQTEKSQMNKMINYWKKVHYQFNQLIEASSPSQQHHAAHLPVNQSSTFTKDSFSSIEMILRKISQQQSLLQRITKNKVLLNKQSKQIVPSTQISLTCKLSGLVLVAILIIVAFTLAVQIETIQSLRGLALLQTEGFYNFRYFTALGVIRYGLVDRFWKKTSTNSVILQSKRFNSSLKRLRMLGHNNYTQVINNQYSQYQSKYKNYLFGNPCTYNPNLLVQNHQNLPNCSQLGNKTLQSGLTAYLRSIIPSVAGYLNGDSVLQEAQVLELTDGLSISSVYYLDLINSWIAKFNVNSKKLTNFNVNKAVGLCLVAILVYVVLIKQCIGADLDDDYEVCKLIYSRMVPGDLFIKDRVKARSIYQTGILA